MLKLQQAENPKNIQVDQLHPFTVDAPNDFKMIQMKNPDINTGGSVFKSIKSGETDELVARKLYGMMAHYYTCDLKNRLP